MSDETLDKMCAPCRTIAIQNREDDKAAASPDSVEGRLVDPAQDTSVWRFISQIAAFTPDHHCETHGADCEDDSCEDRFDMTSEDAVATVNSLIYRGRDLMAERVE